MPHPALRGESRGVPQVAAGSFVFSLDVTVSREPVMLPQGSQASFQVVLALGIAFEELQGNRASSCVKAGKSVFLSSCGRDLRVPIEFQQGSQASSRVQAWNSTFFSSCKRVVRSPV